MPNRQPKTATVPLAAAAGAPAATAAGNLYPGLDTAHFPGLTQMDAYWNAGFRVTCAYLTHGPGIIDQKWIAAAATLSQKGWGLAPVYFGRQLISAAGNPLPPPADPNGAASDDAAEAQTCATNAGLAQGRTIYLDIETTFPPGGQYEDYVLKWIELVKAAGFKVGVYCKRATIPWARAHGLPAWSVHLNSESGYKDPKTGAIHWCYLTSPLPADAIDAGVIGTQTRFYCRAANFDTEIDYDYFSVADPSKLG